MRIRIATLAVLVLLASPVYSATINLVATIDGAQAGTGSPGIGSAVMTFDDMTNQFDWDISWGGLTGTETVMHFHGPAPVGQPAGIQVNFGAISGTSSPSIGGTTITGAQADELLAGLWYINIHTDAFPGGEIRGQVNVVPVPAALWLIVSGLVGLRVFRRRVG